jgi:hypothetical protein
MDMRKIVMIIVRVKMMTVGVMQMTLKQLYLLSNS